MGIGICIPDGMFIDIGFIGMFVWLPFMSIGGICIEGRRLDTGGRVERSGREFVLVDGFGFEGVGVDTLSLVDDACVVDIDGRVVDGSGFNKSSVFTRLGCGEFGKEGALCCCPDGVEVALGWSLMLLGFAE